MEYFILLKTVVTNGVKVVHGGGVECDHGGGISRLLFNRMAARSENMEKYICICRMHGKPAERL